MPDRVVFGPWLDEHVTVAHRRLEAPGVVGPHVERASRHQIEACVMPVAGNEAGLDGPLVQGEAQVRAPVLDRPRSVLVPEHDDRERSELPAQLTLRLQLGERADALFHGDPRFEQRFHKQQLAQSIRPAPQFVKRSLSERHGARLCWRT